METTNDKIVRLKKAFADDGFGVDDKTGIVIEDGLVGMVGTHHTATNYATKAPKKAYYVEGGPRELGCLMGRLAEPEVSRMATEFVDNVVIDMIDEKLPRKLKTVLGKIIAEIAYGLSLKMKPDIPKQYLDEMDGLLEGCRKANAGTKANEKGIWTLNVGVDCLLSIVYRLDLFMDEIRERLTPELETHKDHPDLLANRQHVERVRKVEPKLFRIPFMCNAFSVCRSATVGGAHYVGRDFMFATAGVFQDTAAMTIYNPDPVGGDATFAFISMASPGMVGCVTALNRSAPGAGGTAGAVNMAASGNCDPDRPGLNSLLLVRHAIQHAANTDRALDKLVNAQRGVSWLYLLADGVTDKACIVEAGKSEADLDSLSYAWEEVKYLLPDAAYLKEHPTVSLRNGLAARFSDYAYEDRYVTDFNKRLFRRFFRRIIRGAFDRTGFIDPSWKHKHCPRSYYFAPQRETSPDIVLAGNHFITPEMRLCAMHGWTALVFEGHSDDIQWRYDALNSLLLQSTDGGGTIDYDRAKDLIDFLRPYDTRGKKGPYPDYYSHADRSPDGKQIMIGGCVCLLDLKNNTMESHYGYYCDEWVKLRLNAYL